jgi:hypothetical protein
MSARHIPNCIWYMAWSSPQSIDRLGLLFKTFIQVLGCDVFLCLIIILHNYILVGYHARVKSTSTFFRRLCLGFRLHSVWPLTASFQAIRSDGAEPGKVRTPHLLGLDGLIEIRSGVRCGGIMGEAPCQSFFATWFRSSSTVLQNIFSNFNDIRVHISSLALQIRISPKRIIRAPCI